MSVIFNSLFISVFYINNEISNNEILEILLLLLSYYDKILMNNEEKIWHYIIVDKDKVESFVAKSKTGSVDLKLFGKIVSSGAGDYPPQIIKNTIYKTILATKDRYTN